jgi:radical SAM superfamily enzyme YgiQ (UPF0313 family)
MGRAMKVAFVALSEPYSPYSPPVAALSAAVRAAGHESMFLGFPLESVVRDAADAIAQADCDVVAVTMMSRDWPGVRSLLASVKAKADVFTVVGGYHATLAAQQVAKSRAVDAICIGEGELSLPALLDRIARREDLRSFPGMWLREGEAFVDPIPPSAPGPDIAALPRWDYEVLGGVDRLLDFGVNIFGDRRDRFLPRRASRGCPYDCTFCSAPRWGSAAGYDRKGTRNVWPVEDLCRDLAQLRDLHAPDGFEFWDEHFPVDLEWLRELAGQYPRRVGLPFRAEMHPSAATRQRLELLASAGCVLFHCGVEEGDPEFRRRVLNRRSSDALLQRVFDDARSLGMETSASVMVACPDETPAQIESTLALLRRLRPDHVFCSKYHPLPGTALGDGVAAEPSAELRRFDEYRQLAPLHDPRCIDDAEHAELIAQFDALKRELAAGNRSGSEGPPVDTLPREQ